MVLMLAAMNQQAQEVDSSPASDQRATTKTDTKTEKSGLTKEDWTKTWSVVISQTTTFNTNLEHDLEPRSAFGFVPAVTAGYEMRSKQHRLRMIYGFAAARYTADTELNRLGHYFGGAYRFSSGRFSLETEGEAIFKGTNEDRETGNQFVFTEKLAYRFDRKSRATAYYAFRIKRFAAADAERNAMNPMYGLKYQRELGKKLEFEVGYRYDENRAVSPRQNYVRSTYDASVQYQLTKKDLFVVDARMRRRLYQRTVEVGGLEVPRSDRKYNVGFLWRRELTRHFGCEASYAFEMQRSNDPEKIYRDHQPGFSFYYHWGNGNRILP